MAVSSAAAALGTGRRIRVSALTARGAPAKLDLCSPTVVMARRLGSLAGWRWRSSYPPRGVAVAWATGLDWPGDGLCGKETVVSARGPDFVSHSQCGFYPAPAGCPSSALPGYSLRCSGRLEEGCAAALAVSSNGTLMPLIIKPRFKY